MSDTVHITYLYDPLCGWCYGASGVLRQLAGQPGLNIELAPTGLFSGNGARPMDAQFAAFAWSNDQRIAQLTGQRFSDDYREKVLGQPGGKLDSGPAILALTAVALTAPSAEVAALRLIQEARYGLGLDVTERPALAAILDQGGFGAAAARLAAPDEELVETNRLIIARARALRDEFRVDGVPALIVGDGRDRRLLTASQLLGDADLLSKLLGARTIPAGMPANAGT